MVHARKKTSRIAIKIWQMRLTVSRQNIRIAVAILAVGFFLYGAAAYWLGQKTEQTFWQQYHLIQHSPWFEVKAYSYERGVFHSQAQMELRIKPQVIAFYQALLPKHVQALCKQTIRYRQTIQHGPILHEGGWQFHVGQALAMIELNMSEQAKALLKNLFNGETPITIKHLLRLSGEGQLSIHIPAFNYNEILSGINIAWQGMSVIFDHQKHFSAYSTQITLPNLAVNIPNIGDIAIKKMRYVTHYDNSPFHPLTTQSTLSIGHVATEWNPHISEHSELNKWMSWLSYVKKTTGVINGQHPIHPSAIALTNFRYHLDTKEDHPWIDTRGILQFGRLVIDQKDYGATTLDVTASHLYAPALSKMWTALKDRLSPLTDSAEVRKTYLSIIKQHGYTLLQHQPKITLNQCIIKQKEGSARITGYLMAQALPAQFTDRELFKHLKFEANINVSRKILENLIVTQAEHFFAKNTKSSSTKALAEAAMLTKSLFDLQIQIFLARGLVAENDTQLITTIGLENGQLTLNHQKIALPE